MDTVARHQNRRSGSAAPLSGFIVLAILFLGITNLILIFLFLQMSAHPQTYAECQGSGGLSVTAIDPLTCLTADGRLFMKPLSPDEYARYIPPTETPIPTRARPPAQDGCKIGGCSNELCIEDSDQTTTSSCEIKPYFVCFRNAICERKNGICGWRNDSVLASCLENYTAK